MRKKRADLRKRGASIFHRFDEIKKERKRGEKDIYYDPSRRGGGGEDRSCLQFCTKEPHYFLHIKLKEEKRE